MGTDLLRRSGEEVDGAGLIVFRVAMGLLFALAAVRFVAYGWVDALLLAPAWHFAWIPQAVVPPAPVAYALFAVQLVAGLCVAAGIRYRLALCAFLASFVYVELLDVTLYLNHYVLVTILAATMLFLPLDRPPSAPQPLWGLWLLRIEVGLVYSWAGLCKLNADWLLRGEPLHNWLRARASLPVVGPWLATHEAALAMSWSGAAYDLAIPLLLCRSRTRPVAYALVVAFHVATWLLFPIGIFPWLMILATTVFFPPSWPRRWVRWPAPTSGEPRPLSRLGAAAWIATVVVLALFPARFLLYGRDVNWTEEGFRFAWRVMLIEKTGLVEYRVVERDTGRTWVVRPGDELTPLQHEQMRTQPDLIAQYARHVAERFRSDGHEVAVYVDAWASLNGRPSQRLIRPDIDLSVPASELRHRPWIVALGAR